MNDIIRQALLEHYTSDTSDDFDIFVLNLKRKIDRKLIENCTIEDIDTFVTELEKKNDKLEEDILSLYEEVCNCTKDEEIIDESMKLKLPESSVDVLLSLPLGNFNNYLDNNDLFKEARDRKKKPSDFKFYGSDAVLNINKMRAYILHHGNNDDKELLGDKITSLEKFIERCGKSEKETYELAYGSVRSIYSLYKKVQKRVEKK